MIKGILKNFFKNLIYVFVPMGIVYLAILLVLFFMASSFFNNIHSSGNALAELVQSSSASSNFTVKDFINYAMNQLDWNANPFETMKSVMDHRWIQNTLYGFLETLSLSTEGLNDGIYHIMKDFTATLAGQCITAGVFLSVMFYIASLATRTILRKQIANRNLKKKMLGYVIKPIVEALGVILVAACSFFVGGYFILIVSVYLVIHVTLSLFSAWIIHRDSNLKLSDVLNFNNVGKQLLASAIVIAIVTGISGISFWINEVLGLLISIPFIIYTMNLLDLNADSYVYQLTQE